MAVQTRTPFSTARRSDEIKDALPLSSSSLPPHHKMLDQAYFAQVILLCIYNDSLCLWVCV